MSAATETRSCEAAPAMSAGALQTAPVRVVNCSVFEGFVEKTTRESGPDESGAAAGVTSETFPAIQWGFAPCQTPPLAEVAVRADVDRERRVVHDHHVRRLRTVRLGSPAADRLVDRAPEPAGRGRVIESAVRASVNDVRLGGRARGGRAPVDEQSCAHRLERLAEPRLPNAVVHRVTKLSVGADRSRNVAVPLPVTARATGSSVPSMKGFAKPPMFIDQVGRGCGHERSLTDGHEELVSRGAARAAAPAAPSGARPLAPVPPPPPEPDGAPPVPFEPVVAVELVGAPVAVEEELTVPAAVEASEVDPDAPPPPSSLVAHAGPSAAAVVITVKMVRYGRVFMAKLLQEQHPNTASPRRSCRRRTLVGQRSAEAKGQWISTLDAQPKRSCMFAFLSALTVVQVAGAEGHRFWRRRIVEVPAAVRAAGRRVLHLGECDRRPSAGGVVHVHLFRVRDTGRALGRNLERAGDLASFDLLERSEQIRFGVAAADEEALHGAASLGDLIHVLLAGALEAYGVCRNAARGIGVAGDTAMWAMSSSQPFGDADRHQHDHHLVGGMTGLVGLRPVLGALKCRRQRRPASAAPGLLRLDGADELPFLDIGRRGSTRERGDVNSGWLHAPTSHASFEQVPSERSGARRSALRLPDAWKKAVSACWASVHLLLSSIDFESSNITNMSTGTRAAFALEVAQAASGIDVRTAARRPAVVVEDSGPGPCPALARLRAPVRVLVGAVRAAAGEVDHRERAHRRATEISCCSMAIGHGEPPTLDWPSYLEKFNERQRSLISGGGGRERPVGLEDATRQSRRWIIAARI